jgi:ribosomal RNA-processing protein 17
MAAIEGVAPGNVAEQKVQETEDSDLDQGQGGGQRSDALDTEAEYDDDEQTTTVTIEAVDVTRDGLRKRSEVDSQGLSVDRAEANQHIYPKPTSIRPSAKTKKRKKQFRYESKAERHANRGKEMASSKARMKAKKKD